MYKDLRELYRDVLFGGFNVEVFAEFSDKVVIKGIRKYYDSGISYSSIKYYELTNNKDKISGRWKNIHRSGPVDEDLPMGLIKLSFIRPKNNILVLYAMLLKYGFSVDKVNSNGGKYNVWVKKSSNPLPHLIKLFPRNNEDD